MISKNRGENMKKEKGSALLTVIFITVITSILGAAIFSLIAYNYKLREHDNKIGRAEYETEKAVDTVLVQIKQNYRAVLAYARGEVEAIVDEEFKKGNTIDLNQELYNFLGKENNLIYKDAVGNEFKLNNFDSVIFNGPQINKNELIVDNTKNPIEIVNEIEIIHTGTMPNIKLSLDIVFTIPNEFLVIQGDYDVDKYVNVKNYTMQNWGYL